MFWWKASWLWGLLVLVPGAVCAVPKPQTVPRMGGQQTLTFSVPEGVSGPVDSSLVVKWPKEQRSEISNLALKKTGPDASFFVLRYPLPAVWKPGTELALVLSFTSPPERIRVNTQTTYGKKRSAKLVLTGMVFGRRVQLVRVLLRAEPAPAKPVFASSVVCHDASKLHIATVGQHAISLLYECTNPGPAPVEISKPQVACDQLSHKPVTQLSAPMTLAAGKMTQVAWTVQIPTRAPAEYRCFASFTVNRVMETMPEPVHVAVRQSVFSWQLGYHPRYFLARLMDNHAESLHDDSDAAVLKQHDQGSGVVFRPVPPGFSKSVVLHLKAEDGFVIRRVAWDGALGPYFERVSPKSGAADEWQFVFAPQHPVSEIEVSLMARISFQDARGVLNEEVVPLKLQGSSLVDKTVVHAQGRDVMVWEDDDGADINGEYCHAQTPGIDFTRRVLNRFVQEKPGARCPQAAPGILSWFNRFVPYNAVAMLDGYVVYPGNKELHKVLEPLRLRFVPATRRFALELGGIVGQRQDYTRQDSLEGGARFAGLFHAHRDDRSVLVGNVGAEWTLGGVQGGVPLFPWSKHWNVVTRLGALMEVGAQMPKWSGLGATVRIGAGWAGHTAAYAQQTNWQNHFYLTVGGVLQVRPIPPLRNVYMTIAPAVSLWFPNERLGIGWMVPIGLRFDF